MIEADDNRTSTLSFKIGLLTQHNLQDNDDQMDALEQLYSIKNLEKRQRRLTRTKNELQTSRKIEPGSSDDFVKMLFHSEEEVISWDLLALLQQSKKLVIIAVYGRQTDIESFLRSFTGQAFHMPSDYSDCIYFSRIWQFPNIQEPNCCFMIRYCDRKPMWESVINDVVFTVLSHLIVVLQSPTCDMGVFAQLCRNNLHLVKSITKIEQSLLIRTHREKIDPSVLTTTSGQNNDNRANIFQEVYILQTDPRGEVISFLENVEDETRCLLERTIKRNYFNIVNTESVAHYHLIISLWTYFKRLMAQTDDMLGWVNRPVVSAQTTNIDLNTLTNIYLQVIEKELRYDYKVKAEEYLKDNREEFVLYQCFKEQKQACMQKMKRYCYFMKVEKTKLYGRICEFIKDIEIEVLKWNEEANLKRNIEAAQKCSSNISYKMSKGMYRSSNCDQFEEDFQQFLESYNRECMGQSSGLALSQFLKELIPQVYKYFDAAIKDEIREIVSHRHTSEPQEGLHERIVMTEGLLYTLERDIIDIEIKRLAVEKARRVKHKESYEAKQALRQTKEEIHKLRRMMKTQKQLARRQTEQPSVRKPQKQKSSRKCTIF